MKNRTIKLDNDFKIKIIVRNNVDSNYKQFAHVVLSNSTNKQAIIGRSFNDKASNNDIQQEMQKSLYSNPFLVREILNKK